MSVNGKKTTVREIAKQSGVSITTVSRFLNRDYSSMSDATRKRIQEVIRESGYVNTKMKSGGTIAAVVPSLLDPFFAELIEKLEDGVTREGFSLRLCLTHDSLEEEEKTIRNLLSANVDGIVYLSSVTFEENCYELLIKEKKPFVVMDSYLSEYEVPAMVFSNGVYGMYQMTRYLLEAGHENIAYLSGLRFGMFEHYRYQGYVNALLDSSYVVNPKLVRFIGFGMKDGEDGFRELLASGEKFSAIICESDQLAAGVYKACRSEGISIPADLSVVGYNNSSVAGILEPELTSVDQRMDLMVDEAVRMLKKQILGQELTKHVCMIEPELIFRDSVRMIGRD